MSIDLYIAGAGHGKSDFVCEQLQEAVGDLARTPLVCVPTAWQARAWRRRLARRGVIGVRVVTFTELYQGCLDHAGDACAVLPEPVQHALLQRIVDNLVADGRLHAYHTVHRKPGFIQKAQELINELKTARIPPDDFRQGAANARLHDLAEIYEAYGEVLARYGNEHPPLTDAAGFAEHALALLQEGRGCPPTWSLITFDGFDVLTSLRVAFVRALGARYRVLITLTGPGDGSYARAVHVRFRETYERLQNELADDEWSLHTLPRAEPPQQAAVAHLEATLFQMEASTNPAHDAIACRVAPDRAGEVWRAMRWLKERVVEDGLALDEVALVAREIEPYRALIRDTADAAGIPVRFENGVPLSENPAVGALLSLLRLFRPRTVDEAGRALSRVGVVEVVRSPYLDWNAALGLATEENAAGKLNAVAYWARVEAGQEEWESALRTLSADGQARDVPETVPQGPEAQALWRWWEQFTAFMAWSEDIHELEEFVDHVETLIGGEETHRPGSLNVAACACEYDATRVEDLAALRAFKELLRGMLWAAQATNMSPLTYADFLDQLQAAVDGAVYEPPAGSPALSVARVFDLRGVPLQALAVLGLAEGEFPPAGGEEVLLNDADRAALNERLPQRLPFRLRLEEDDRALFYDVATRPRRKMLLTRPHRADDGSEWPASAYWDEVERLLQDVVIPADQWREPVDLTPAEVDRRESLLQPAAIFSRRYGGRKGAHDGDCTPFATYFGEHFDRDYTWSPSRLERYTMCPHFFYVDYVLRLAGRDEPEEDPQLYHLGNIYHRIFQELFVPLSGEETSLCDRSGSPLDLETLQQRANAVVEAVLEEAPAHFGFRPPAWWPAIRRQIREDVRRSLPPLVERAVDFYPVAAEHYFETEIPAADDGDAFRLRGYIDRIDRDDAGRLRVLDYKLGSPSSHDKYALEKGKKIQLPLYALALQSVCDLEEPPDGFYWHVRHGEASDALSDYGDGGVQGAVRAARAYAQQAIEGARRGQFHPEPPEDGCPRYCTAAAFCWHYTPRFGG